ncbi:MAG: DoxX family membrane protein [Flavobacteriaceae bacterium]|nr:DoxX family membrane protein [Flavobacteriaceae bacterium]
MNKFIQLFLRIALSAGFLSAVADRLGLYPAEISVWGNMNAFLQYTQSMMPWAPAAVIPFMGWTATILEIIFGICLLLGLKTKLFAQLSGILLLIFGLTMLVAFGFKTPLDYSVFAASAAAFALSTMKGEFFELDQIK